MLVTHISHFFLSNFSISNGMMGVFVAFKVEQYLMMNEFKNNINADASPTQLKKDILMAEDET